MHDDDVHGENFVDGLGLKRGEEGGGGGGGVVCDLTSPLLCSTNKLL